MPEGTSTPHVSVREWTDVVRRARLGKTTKYVALVLATFADFADGTRVYPGLATLAYAAEIDHKTAKKAVAELLRVGLIEIVKAHSGTRGRGTEYRLVLGEDLFEQVEVPSPERARTEADRIGRAQRRSRGTGSPGPRTPGGQPVDNSGVQGLPAPVLGSEPAAEPEGVRGTPDPQPTEVRGISRPQYGVSDAPRTPTDRDTTSNSQTLADLRTAVTATGAREAEDSISLGCSKCVKGYSLVGDQLQRCPDCWPDNVIPIRPQVA